MELLWISEYPDDSGGIGNCSKNVVSGLIDRGFKIDVLNNAGVGDENVIGSVPKDRKSWKNVLENDYDFILIQYPGVSTYSLTILSLYLDENSLMVMHEIPKGLRFSPMIFGLKNFAFLSENAEKEFKENFGLLDHFRMSRFFDLPYHGVEKDLKEKLREIDFEIDLDPEKKNIVLPGYLVKRKQYHKVVTAMPDILEKYPDARLILAGGAHRSEGREYQEDIEKIIRSKNLEDYVKITGELESELELFKYINEADLCILPYNNIYQSGVLARSLALDTPTIVSQTPGLREPVEEYGGLILDNVTKSELIKMVSKAFDEEVLIDSERFLKDMNWDKRIDHYEKIIREIVD